MVMLCSPEASSACPDLLRWMEQGLGVRVVIGLRASKERSQAGPSTSGVFPCLVCRCGHCKALHADW